MDARHQQITVHRFGQGNFSPHRRVGIRGQMKFAPPKLCSQFTANASRFSGIRGAEILEI